jgi:hypothetical protein
MSSGLFGSFISRNNDVGGYWGIGKLCLLARHSATATVKIDLLPKTITPESKEFTKLVEGYLSFLQKHLAARDIPIGWVASAIVELEFMPADQPEKQIPIITWGNLFKVSVTIVDDRNKKHTVSGFSYCGPHSPWKEHRSVGQRF